MPSAAIKARVTDKRRSVFLTPIFFPVALTVILFGATIFMLILPMFENRLMDGKREMIRELVESAWSSLDAYAAMEKSGALDRKDAQARAIDHLRQLRYGRDLKDYFWINDMRPYMVMHPYRTDLEGHDVSSYRDASDKQIFVEMVRVVQKKDSGYVDYDWQWLDDPGRVVPKISYVKGFAPWGWIVGTGIYVEDVRQEISAVTRKMTVICIGILVFVIALSLHVVWLGAKVTRAKEKAEQQAMERQEQLFQASKMVSVGTLVSGVAHEINNPITAILLNAPNLRKIWDAATPIIDAHCETKGDFAVGGSSYARLRDRIPQMLSGITENAKRVRDIVADLKDFAREKPPLMIDQVDLNEVVEKATGLAANLIKKSTDHFQLDCKPDLPTFVGNAQRIEQVVINLVVNACQALPDSSRALTVRTYFASSTDRVVLEIQDQGVGIEEALVRQITDPFFTTKRESGGTGLGLSITDRIVCDHEGQMTFESVPGQGTTVRVFFPGNTKNAESESEHG